MNKERMISVMSCGHCVRRVKKALEGLDGIEAVEVNLEAGSADVQDAKGLSDQEIANVIDEAGYDVVSIDSL